jgi:hypothetical protein
LRRTCGPLRPLGVRVWVPSHHVVHCIVCPFCRAGCGAHPGASHHHHHHHTTTTTTTQPPTHPSAARHTHTLSATYPCSQSWRPASGGVGLHDDTSSLPWVSLTLCPLLSLMWAWGPPPSPIPVAAQRLCGASRGRRICTRGEAAGKLTRASTGTHAAEARLAGCTTAGCTYMLLGAVRCTTDPLALSVSNGPTAIPEQRRLYTPWASIATHAQTDTHAHHHPWGGGWESQHA